MTLKLDRMMYLVISDHHEGPIVWEVQLSRMNLVTVTKDLLHKQYGDVLAVIEFNPVEHFCRDATREFETLLEGEDEA